MVYYHEWNLRDENKTKEEIGRIMGVQNEFMKLRSSLTTIQAVLEDADQKQWQDPSIRNWVAKLSDLSYEIEDIVDVCATASEKLEFKNKFAFILKKRDIAKKIVEVTKKLDYVAAEGTNFHLRENFGSRRNKVDALPHNTISKWAEGVVYGRENDKQKIVDVLLNKVSRNEEISILPVVGMAGVGKTTVAQLVFNDKRVSDHFDTKLWICVSGSFHLQSFLKEMIDLATLRSISGSVTPEGLEFLMRKLVEILNKKRYLLVMDGVWDDIKTEWSVLKRILSCGARGTTVIITTRLKIVADITSTLPVHNLKKLSDIDCWLLFRNWAFGQGNMAEHPNLEEIGKQIVLKCHGIPLAAKALGGLLQLTRDETDWLHLRDSEIWNLPEDESPILPALKLSYDNLTAELKRCFVYCTLFPKDTEIEKEELIFMWMAHGCLSSSDGTQEVECVGHEMWNKLFCRSFFHDVCTSSNGKTKFKMHTLLHDLCRYIMENKFLSGQQADSSSISRIRHVNLRNKFVAFPIGTGREMDQFSVMKFIGLRSLDASGTDIDDLPSEIGDLIHLRYLNLSYTRILCLPYSICKLWNLIVLKLEFCKRFQSLPNEMKNMRNLRHVFLKGCQRLCGMPPEMRELSFLRTLTMFVVNEFTDDQLGQLQYLNLEGRLEITKLERVRRLSEGQKANLVAKKNIHDLVLKWEVDDGSAHRVIMDEKVLEGLEPHPKSIKALEIFGFKGRNFPLWMMRVSTLQNVIRIQILKCPNCVSLPQVFGDLPVLKFMTLCGMPKMKYITDDQGDVTTKFPSLEKLELCDLPCLKALLKKKKAGGQMFSNLQRIRLYGNISSVLQFDCSSSTSPSCPHS